MFIAHLFIQVAVLWCLIAIYSGSSGSSSSVQHESWVVIIGVAIVGIVSRLLLAGILGPFTDVIPLIALYFLVDKVCDLGRDKTIKICSFYVVIMIMLGIVGHILATPA